MRKEQKKVSCSAVQYLRISLSVLELSWLPLFTPRELHGYKTTAVLSWDKIRCLTPHKNEFLNSLWTERLEATASSPDSGQYMKALDDVATSGSMESGSFSRRCFPFPITTVLEIPTYHKTHIHVRSFSVLKHNNNQFSDLARCPQIPALCKRHLLCLTCT